MINKVILVGNTGIDPVIKNLDNGAKVAQFTLATSETYKDKDGNRQTKTEWHKIVVWRGLADVAEKYVKKGNPLYIEGKITNRSYEKDGETRYVTEIVANTMQMLGGAKKEEGVQLSPSSQSAPVVAGDPGPLETDDLPF